MVIMPASLSALRCLEKIKYQDAHIATYCLRGGRCALAAEVLKKIGYTNVTTLKGWLNLFYQSNRMILYKFYLFLVLFSVLLLKRNR